MSGGRCRWCARFHKDRFLCDPAKKILDALYAKGMEGNMPSVEFPEPIAGDQLGLGLGADDRLVGQLVVQAATVHVAGVPRPTVIMTGREASGRVLPQWIYPGDDDDMARLASLVADMTAMAVRGAAQQRGD